MSTEHRLCVYTHLRGFSLSPPSPLPNMLCTERVYTPLSTFSHCTQIGCLHVRGLPAFASRGWIAIEMHGDVTRQCCSTRWWPPEYHPPTIPHTPASLTSCPYLLSLSPRFCAAGRMRECDRISNRRGGRSSSPPHPSPKKLRIKNKIYLRSTISCGTRHLPSSLIVVKSSRGNFDVMKALM